MKVTIKDIAKMAGVTHPTVSKALNGAPGVSPEIRRKIAAIAVQLNYVPNLAAKRLVDSKNDSIGLIWPRSEGLFFYHLCMEIQKEAFKRGLNVLISMAEPPQALRSFNEHFIDQVVFWCPPNWTPSAEFMQRKEWFQGGVLLMGGGNLEGTHRIVIDRKGGIFQAVKHLADIGHRRIAYIGERSDKSQGYTQGILDMKLDYDPYFMVLAEEGEGFPGDRLDALLNQADKPTAFIVDNQPFFFELQKRLRERKVRIPDDYSLVVYDDIPEMEIMETPVTTVGPSIKQLAYTALDLLDTAGRRPKEKSWSSVEIKCELTVRQSTKRLT